jgi:hypothetical protein
MASSFFDCCRAAVAPVAMAVRRVKASALADAAEVARGSCSVLDKFRGRTGGAAIIVGEPTSAQICSEISVAVNVGEGALLGPMMLRWLS